MDGWISRFDKRAITLSPPPFPGPRPETRLLLLSQSEGVEEQFSGRELSSPRFGVRGEREIPRWR